MTTAFKLGLPIDIPWKRICVTEDMVDRVVCNSVLPPKWHSSIAVFKYRPDDEYQNYPDYDITYLKVTCTITGYQALEDETQGRIDWNGLDVSTRDGIMELLGRYYPCTGAILQVVVGPESPPDERPPLSFSQYPFFMDFEPKKRELYEMATDTNEKQSRSIESLTLGKSAGSTKSLEVLDVDMGGSTSVGASASYAGTGGSFNFSSSNQGQWGTKSVNGQESQSTRTSELGTERRETQSFTTQLSQMYQLLDSYHAGTNRAVFFIQPRPHVLEEPSGFVRGPRKVEGIQEFFLVVAAPKDRPDYCVSARLDTAHLAESDVFDYETRSDVSDLATASARVPTKDDIPDGTTTREACFFGCWDVTYVCYRTHDVDDVVYNAPAGFKITGYTDLVNQHDSHGSTSVSVAPNGQTLTVHAEANGHICFEDSGVCVNCPDEVDKWAGSARRQVQVQLRSTEPIRKVGTRTSLLLTTRGLCCCRHSVKRSPRGVIIAELPRDLATIPSVSSLAARAASVNAVAEQQLSELGAEQATRTGDCGCREKWTGSDRTLPTIRQANAISDLVREELTKRITAADLAPQHAPFIETEFFARQVEGIVNRTRRGRESLSAKAEFPPALRKHLAGRLGCKLDDLSRRDVLRFRSEDLAHDSGLSLSEVQRIKLSALGVPLSARKEDDGADSTGATSTPNRRTKE